MCAPERFPTRSPGHAGVQGVRAEAAEREAARLEAHVADLRAELERRRWPGQWPALKRFWRGDG